MDQEVSTESGSTQLPSEEQLRSTAESTKLKTAPRISS